MNIEQKLSDLESGLDELRAEIEAGKASGKVLIMGHHTGGITGQALERLSAAKLRRDLGPG